MARKGKAGKTKTKRTVKSTSATKKSKSKPQPGVPDRRQIIPVNKIAFPGFFVGFKHREPKSVCIATRGRLKSNHHQIFRQIGNVLLQKLCAPAKMDLPDILRGTRRCMKTNTDVAVLDASQKREFNTLLEAFESNYNAAVEEFVKQFPALSVCFFAAKELKLVDYAAAKKALLKSKNNQAELKDDITAFIQERSCLRTRARNRPRTSSQRRRRRRIRRHSHLIRQCRGRQCRCRHSRSSRRRTCLRLGALSIRPVLLSAHPPPHLYY